MKQDERAVAQATAEEEQSAALGAAAQTEVAEATEDAERAVADLLVRISEDVGGLKERTTHGDAGSGGAGGFGERTEEQEEEIAALEEERERQGAIAALEVKLSKFYAIHSPEHQAKVPEVAKAYWDEVETGDPLLTPQWRPRREVRSRPGRPGGCEHSRAKNNYEKRHEHLQQCEKIKTAELPYAQCGCGS